MRFLYFLLLFSVIHVVSFGGCEVFFEVGDAGLDEDVVPLDELLDVAVLHAVLIPVGQHLREVCVQLSGCGFLEIHAGGLALLQVAHGCQHLHEGDILCLCEHGDVA